MKKSFGKIAIVFLVATTSANAAPKMAAPIKSPNLANSSTVSKKDAPLDPASVALAHQIVTIAFPPEKRSQMFGSMMDSVVEQTRKNVQSHVKSGDKEFQTLLDRSSERMFEAMKTSVESSLPDIFKSFERAYARSFSHDDLVAILAFVKTPAGQRYFERAPQLLKDPDVEAATGRMTAQLFTKLPQIQRETMREVEDYVATKNEEEKSARPTPVS